MNRDELRSARLLFAPELASGRVSEGDLNTRAVRKAVRDRGLPPRVVRMGHRVAAKLGWLTYERAVLQPFMRARESVLGDDARGQPRLLVRVDEFPHYLGHGAPRHERVYASEHYLAFHGAMASVGVPYLLAVTPRVSRDPLDPGDDESRALDEFEVEILGRLAADGVEFGMHGLMHRTRFASPSRHSELVGLSQRGVEELVASSAALLESADVDTRVFVPPYNRFEPGQYGVLARRFDVVCGGPENILLLGYARTPLWRGDAVYLPSYEPFYGDAESLKPALERLRELECPVWVPVSLHWGWEFENDWSSLSELTSMLAPHARPWGEFFAEIEQSGEAAGGCARGSPSLDV